MTNDFSVDAGSEWAYTDTESINELDTVMSVGTISVVEDVEEDVEGDADAEDEVDTTSDIEAEGEINTSSASGLVIGSVFTVYALFTTQF